MSGDQANYSKIRTLFKQVLDGLELEGITEKQIDQGAFLLSWIKNMLEFYNKQYNEKIDVNVLLIVLAIVVHSVTEDEDELNFFLDILAKLREIDQKI